MNYREPCQDLVRDCIKMLSNLARNVPKCAFGATIFSILYTPCMQDYAKLCNAMQCNVMMACQVMQELHYVMQELCKNYVNVACKIRSTMQKCDKNVTCPIKCVHTKRLVEMSTSLNFTVSGFI